MVASHGIGENGQGDFILMLLVNQSIGSGKHSNLVAFNLLPQCATLNEYVPLFPLSSLFEKKKKGKKGKNKVFASCLIETQL